MQYMKTIGVAVLAAALGAAAVYFAMQHGPDPRDEAREAETPPKTDARDAEIARLRAELADAWRRPAVTQEAPPAKAPEVARPAAPVAPPPPVVETDAAARARVDKATSEYLAALKVPKGVADEAAALGVSDQTLHEMYAAELLLHFAAQSPEGSATHRAADDALHVLASRGDEGYFAVIANARGNPQNTSRVDQLAAATWHTGLEAKLVDWLKTQPAQSTVSQPLRALGASDSETTREFLRDALRRYDDHASNFAATAAALGALKDGGSASLVAPKLRVSAWSGLRASLLDSLGRMGGPEARRVLVDYLRDPEGESESAALAALTLIDPEAARAEAKALLDGTSPNKLSEVERSLVQRLTAK